MPSIATIQGRGLTAAVMGVLMLAACGAPRQVPVEGKVAPEDVQPITVPSPIPKKAEPSPARLAMLKQYNLDETPRLDRLVGLVSQDIRRLLGQPDFKRVDDGVEIWQYRTEQCIVDLFLYYHQDQWRVDHADMRGTQLGNGPKAACFKDMILKG